MKIMLNLVFTVLVFSIILSSHLKADYESEGYYGVLAISHNTGRYGFCYAHHKNKQDAANDALGFCNARDAKVVLWVKNGWFALATGGGGAFGWAYGPDPDEVRENAITECLRYSRSAKIVLFEHSNKKKHVANYLKSPSTKTGWDYPKSSDN